jgi:AmmeMemoRadiSam system protein B/AmmeMemoRadiSam system protein A
LRILVFFYLLLIVFSPGCRAENIEVKEPAVAGTFYPSDRETLKKSIEEFLSKIEKSKVEGKLIALISPHAGYMYSGQVAAYGYKQIEGSDIKKVILIGPSHRSALKGASVYTKGSFKTPLGDVKINESLALSLLNESADIRFSPEVYDGEHSLEVQLPFLQTVLKDFTIVPILLGSTTGKTIEHLIMKLTEIFDERTLIVASTDLSHYYDYVTANEMDEKLISALERISLKDTVDLLRSGKSEMCGAVPVLIAMEVAKRCGANLGVVFKQANSGDVTGEKERVVGYVSLGLFNSPYSNEEKKELIDIARKAITDYVINQKESVIEVKNPKFKTDGAVFVTIKVKGSLRGCIGHIQAIMPLYQSIIKNAIAACSSDPRFPPMTKEELKDMEIEISILSPFLRLNNIKNIQVGKHGLYIIKGLHSGLLLPQVATEFGWNREEFLKQVCLKAGLPGDAWNDAELYTFTAEIIR